MTTKAETQRIANELTKWRERHGLSQRAAALALGCSRGAWRKWESGDQPVPDYIRPAMRNITDGNQLEQPIR
jgi:transcriptional regulator with XRE-family HTH domain